MNLNRRGQSLTELAVVLVIMGIMAMVVIPRFSLSAVGEKKAEVFAGKMVTDLRRARRLSISDAANNSAGYELSVQGAGYEIKDLGDDSVVDSHVIDSGVSCSAGVFGFGPFGNLLSGSDASLSISSGGRSFTVSVVSATGMVKCVED